MTTWADLLTVAKDMAGVDVARLQAGYDASADIWDCLPVTIAVYAMRGGDFWHVAVTPLFADGIARCALAVVVYDFRHAMQAAERLTAAVYADYHEIARAWLED